MTLLNSYYGTEAHEVPYAHTSPVYVTVDEKPIRSHSDAEYFVRYLDNAIHFLNTEGKFSSEETKQFVLRKFKEGRQRFLYLAEYR
ncbi:hypothetical protein ACFL40_05490 [candidate division KSB1 bacterium]